MQDVAWKVSWYAREGDRRCSIAGLTVAKTLGSAWLAALAEVATVALTHKCRPLSEDVAIVIKLVGEGTFENGELDKNPDQVLAQVVDWEHAVSDADQHFNRSTIGPRKGVGQ
jgi:hypothetical protein